MSHNRDSGSLGISISNETCDDVNRSGDASYGVNLEIYGAAFEGAKDADDEGSPILGSHDNAGSTDEGKDTKEDY